MADVAAFDFDGTLTDGGSVFGFLAAVAGLPAVLAASAGLSPRLARAGLAGGELADRTKEELFARVLGGVPLGRAREVAARYGRDHLEVHRRPDVARRLDWHRDRGDRVVIVSASPELYVGAAGRVLGVDAVIATRLAVDGAGNLTGRYEGANCRGLEKHRRLTGWVAANAPPASQVWAYGNSRGDLRMLAAADVGVDVSRLGRLGRLRRYPRLATTGPGN